MMQKPKTARPYLNQLVLSFKWLDCLTIPWRILAYTCWLGFLLVNVNYFLKQGYRIIKLSPCLFSLAFLECVCTLVFVPVTAWKQSAFRASPATSNCDQITAFKVDSLSNVPSNLMNSWHAVCPPCRHASMFR